MINRRTFLTGSITVTLLGSPLFSALAEKKKKRNLVVISLRGGMDGLSAVPPIDPKLEKFRPDILVKKTLPLTSDFALHPSLKNFHMPGNKVKQQLYMLQIYLIRCVHILKDKI